MDPLSVPKEGESKFFITTYLRLDKLFFLNHGPDVTQCPKAEDIDIPPGANFIEDVYDVCIYNAFEQYFAIAPEEIEIVSDLAMNSEIDVS